MADVNGDVNGELENEEVCFDVALLRVVFDSCMSIVFDSAIPPARFWKKFLL
jgi:hypothetical protein